MSTEADPLERLTHALRKLPGIGERSAQRLAFHLLQAPPELAIGLGQTLIEVRESVRTCSQCGFLTESDPCRFCTSPHRQSGSICVVESSADVLAIERTGVFEGRYHVLHGLLRPLDGIGPDQLHLAPLLERATPPETREVIVAFTPGVEGDATALYLSRLLTPLGLRVSRLAMGLPMGGELEYTDRATLSLAFSSRRPFSRGVDSSDWEP